MYGIRNLNACFFSTCSLTDVAANIAETLDPYGWHSIQGGQLPTTKSQSSLKFTASSGLLSLNAIRLPSGMEEQLAGAV
jgi:hypothetical protein